MTESTVTAALVAQHGLTPEEHDRIRAILGREPTLTELGIFSVMWSEHCSYKSSRVHLGRLPTEGPQVLQGPGENAGVVDVGDGYAAVFKIESHNHPSFVEPFQGAATGVGGILRDIFTMGARPIAVLDSLRFGPLADARNRRILEGVVSGIAFYGNCFGVPTIGGEIVCEPCYAANPLVNVLALGIASKDKLFYARARGVGNPILYVGAKTGRDGIHGASLLASAEFGEESQAKRPNVQVGDPFLEKLLLEACLEAIATGAVVAIQDMGAAGLTCSTSEMGARGGTGMEMELAQVPQRETSMTPYEIMLSESQERMLLVAERGREEELFAIFRKWGLDAVAIGQVTGDGLLRVRDHGQVVAEIPNRALADEAPVYERPSAPPPPRQERFVEFLDELGKERRDTLEENFRKLLASPSIASKRWVFEQYDYMVRTNTAVGPGSDAAVIRLKDTKRALALTVDGNGRWCWLAPRLGAQHAVAEAARNLVAVGARPWAVTNCLNFGNPEKPEIMWQFSEVVAGMAEACGALGTPVTGGNVSFYNETLGRGVYPTPVIGMLGVIEDVARAVTPGWKAVDDVIVLLGVVPAGIVSAVPREELRRTFSSSEYAKTICGVVAGAPPGLDLDYEHRVHQCVLEAIARGWVRSAHDISDGGLATALAESSFASAERLGLRVEVVGDLPAEVAFFGEEPSRLLLSLAAKEVSGLRRLALEYRVGFWELGRVVEKEFQIKAKGSVEINLPVVELEATWAKALESALHAPSSAPGQSRTQRA